MLMPSMLFFVIKSFRLSVTILFVIVLIVVAPKYRNVC